MQSAPACGLGAPLREALGKTRAGSVIIGPCMRAFHPAPWACARPLNLNDPIPAVDPKLLFIAVEPGLRGRCQSALSPYA
jgi:hypothetical protein